MKQETLEESEFSMPMYKKDSLYSSSNQELSEFKNSETKESVVEPTATNSKKTLSKLLVEIFKEMTNFRLLFENKSFLLIVIANFFVFVGYFLPFIYIPIRGRELEIKNISMVLSVIGILN